MKQAAEKIKRDRIYHWLSAGYTHVVTYTKPYTEEALSYTYFAACGSLKELEDQKEKLENNGMIHVKLIHLQEVLLQYV